MTLTCPRAETHRVFQRDIEVEGPTVALLDQHGDVVEYKDCQSFRMVRSTTNVRCAFCGEKPTIRL